jgi:hypothetical protein
MPADGDSIEWDFLTLISWWNLFGLPLLLLVVAAAVLIRQRRRPQAAAGLDALRTVRLIGLIHYGLALRALCQLTQELLTMRAMGISESFANLITSTLAVLVNPLLALRLRHQPPRGRWWAIAWYAFLSSIAIAVTRWLWHYHVEIDPARWPDHLIGYGLPLLLLAVMLLPRTRRAFAAAAACEPDREPADGEPAPALTLTLRAVTPPRWSMVSLLILLLLIVVLSTLALDLIDWTRLSALESE